MLVSLLPKEPTLREMLAAMRRTGDEFKELEVRHVMRASNKTADTLANKAIDIKQGKSHSGGGIRAEMMNDVYCK